MGITAPGIQALIELRPGLRPVQSVVVQAREGSGQNRRMERNRCCVRSAKRRSKMSTYRTISYARSAKRGVFVWSKLRENAAIFLQLGCADVALMVPFRASWPHRLPRSRAAFLAYAAKFSPQPGQGAALRNGPAPWPVAPTVQDENCQILATTRSWPLQDKSWGQRRLPLSGPSVIVRVLEVDSPSLMLVGAVGRRN